jgi:hypothetical protein
VSPTTHLTCRVCFALFCFCFFFLSFFLGRLPPLFPSPMWHQIGPPRLCNTPRWNSPGTCRITVDLDCSHNIGRCHFALCNGVFGSVSRALAGVRSSSELYTSLSSASFGGFLVTLSNSLELSLFLTPSSSVSLIAFVLSLTSVAKLSKKKKLKADQIPKEDDFALYLASDSSSDESDGEALSESGDTAHKGVRASERERESVCVCMCVFMIFLILWCRCGIRLCKHVHLDPRTISLQLSLRWPSSVSFLAAKADGTRW